MASSEGVDDAGPAPTQPTSNEDSITIIVKNPTDRPGTPPFTLSLPYTSTVAQIKENLASAYPGSPPVQSQRLIYAGKLLQNNSKLPDIMPNADLSAAHTVHLVVSPRGNQPHQTRQPTTTPPTSSPPHNPPNPPEGAYPYPLPMPPFQPTMGPPFLGGIAPSFPMPPFGAPYVPPPSDDPNHPSAAGVPSSRQPQMPNFSNLPPNFPMHPTMYPGVDPASDHAHLQTMERLIGESWQAHAHATASATAAHANAHNAALAAQLHAQAAHFDAHAAALHAQAHAHARAHAMTAAQNQQQQQQQQDGSQPNPAANVNAQAAPPAGAVGPGFPNPAAAMGGVPGMPRVMFDFRMGRMGPDGAAAPNPNDPRVRHFVFQFQINWVLLLKLAVFVYILSQDASTQRVLLLIGVAIVIYLWQMGHLRFFRRIIAAVIPNPRQLMENLFPPLQRQRQQQPQQNVPQGAHSNAGETQPQRRTPHRFGRVVILFSLLYSFVYGFVCSLLPAWNPEPHARIDEILQNREPRRADDQLRNAPDDGAHEHEE